jgi:putative FmdB family regulatory protein
MAAYDYRGRSCGTVFEVRRGITDAAGQVSCPAGHDSAVRVWSAVAVTSGAVASGAVASGAGSAPAPSGGGCCGGACGCASAR